MADGRWRRVALMLAVVLVAMMVPVFAVAGAKPGQPATSGNNGPAVTFVSPSPAAGATVSSGDASFAFTYNRTAKQTKALTCVLVGPTASSGPCTPPATAPGGSSSGDTYSGLASGSYTFTVTVALTDGGTASASRQFTVSSTSCTSGLSASVPAQDGARDGQTFYGSPAPDPSSVPWWGLPVPAGLTAVISRGHDIELDANLTGGCADAAAWTYSWSYQLGDAASETVPSTWSGATGATLTVPKWSLQFSDVTHEDYTFTVTATPPASSTQQPLTASVMVRVGSFDPPTAGFYPSDPAYVTPGEPYFSHALGGSCCGLPYSSSADSPPDQQDQLGFTWYAEETFDGTVITPDSGQGTPTVQYTWPPSQSIRLTLTVCSADAPTSPTNPCASTDTYITTNE